jgi:hypothetical protein
MIYLEKLLKDFFLNSIYRMAKTNLLPKLTEKDIKNYRDALLSIGGYDTIYQARKELKVKTANEAYKLLLDRYNAMIDDMNEKKMKKESNKKIKSDVAENLKMMKEETRERKTHERSALGGAFKESYIYADDVVGLDNTLTFDDVKNAGDDNIIYNLLVAKLKSEMKIANSTASNIGAHPSKTPTASGIAKFSIRAFIVIKSQMYREYTNENGQTITEYKEHYYNSPIRDIVSVNNVSQFINDVFQGFYEAITNAKDGSDWIFKKFLRFTIASNKYPSVLGKSYIKLPEVIANKKACVNIKNNDNLCFDYCLIAHKKYDSIKAKDKNMPYHYKKHWDSIKRPAGILYPVTTDDIPQYEELNDIQINVFELIDYNDEVEDVRTCIQEVYKSNQHRKEVVNMLLVRDGINSHYILVKNLSRLFASKTYNKSLHFCPHCLTKSFLSSELLDNHISTCANYCESDKVNCDVTYKCPDGECNILKFRNHQNEFRHPFHIIADFESTLVPCDDDTETSTQRYQKHLQNSFGLKYCCIHNEYDEDVRLYNSSDPDQVCEAFIDSIEKYAIKSYQLLQQNKSTINWTAKQLAKHSSVTHCERCNMEFSESVKKVAHHDHITGKFIASLCNQCNLAYRYKTFLPIYIHNLKGYDAHLFINALHKYGQQVSDITCIPNNEERYISFSKSIKVDEYLDKETKKVKPIMFELRFLDTIAFMNSSVESLVDNLRNGCKSTDDLRERFPNTSKHFSDNTQFILMTEKGVYPYDFIDSYEKLHITALPPREAFYSKLYDAECSEADYTQAVKVWNTFQCGTFLDYHNLYLKSDVLLLADVWESFRNTCYEYYNLDCCYYYTAPGLSFDAMLKHTGVELELFTDVDMYEFVESGIRGGLSQISTRHAVANNKYMSNYDTTKEDSYILYLDANNLYGWAMSQYLPTCDFNWNDDKWNAERIMAVADDAKTGYMFEVDLHIPEHLHDKFNNYVPCPENFQVCKSDLNQFQQEDYQESKIRKLCCSFKDKVNYVVNYRYLKLVLSLGVELVHVNRVLQFTQSNFLKSYIELNTNLRKKAKNDFEKDFFKLMNNAVFGKTMENVRARINFRLVSNEDQAWRVKNLNRFTIFSNDLVGVHIQKKIVHLNKPVYLGQTILDDSKYLMYNFHYNFMLQKIPRNDIDLLFTDTDSLCYHIRNHDVFEIMKQNKEMFDLSEYPEHHELFDPTNKKVIGKFKNESIDQITEFVGLRAKLYAFSVDKTSKKHLKCKGVKKGVAKRELNIDMYRSVLYSRGSKSVSQCGIRSYRHQLYTECVTKVALSAKDDKVFLCDDNIHTYNFGHYRTRQ